MFGALSLRNYGSTQQRYREIIVCLLLSPLKFQEKMRFLLLALDPGVFPPHLLGLFPNSHCSCSATKRKQGAASGIPFGKGQGAWHLPPPSAQGDSHPAPVPAQPLPLGSHKAQLGRFNIPAPKELNPALQREMFPSSEVLRSAGGT